LLPTRLASARIIQFPQRLPASLSRKIHFLGLWSFFLSHANLSAPLILFSDGMRLVLFAGTGAACILGHRMKYPCSVVSCVTLCSRGPKPIRP